MNTNAAGILFRTKSEDQVLFLKRGPGGDYPGFWCLPGGRQEENESIEECATREAKEEVGSLPPGKRNFLCRSISFDPADPVPKVQEPGSLPLPEPIGGTGDFTPLAPVPPTTSVNDEPHGVDFTTYLQVIDDKFEVVKDGEHVGFAWAPPDQPPEPLHPGVRTSLDILLGDELTIAEAMKAGKITSPHRYKNIVFFKMRVTGTGYAFRKGKKDDKGKVVREEEFTLRDPEIYLTDRFCQRCAGLPVIFYHPEKKMMLDAQEFSDRIIGTVMLAFIEGNDVMAITRIYDDDAIVLMASKQITSTSPGVIVSGDDPKITLEDGKKLLFEGKPSLLDHLAICERGVWDKGTEPHGIVVNDSDDVLPLLSKMKKALTELNTKLEAV